MAKHYAQIGPDSVVLRVVVAEDPIWLASTLGGTWVETSNEDPVEHYAGRLMHDAGEICQPRFIPSWQHPQSAEETYSKGAMVWHVGNAWLSLADNNANEPGLLFWRAYLEPWPEWVQPAGGHDAYITGERVTFEGAHYVSAVDANAHSPALAPANWTLTP